MSDNAMIRRLQFLGGDMEGRINQAKLFSMKGALWSSYQAATVELLRTGKTFRCLMNRDKIKANYDDQVISIPFKDIELNMPKRGRKTFEGLETIGLKGGDIFYWKQTNTYWIVYLPIVNETAYFRSEVRRCNQEIEIDGRKYKVYLRGEVETTIPWSQKHQIMVNTPNYSAEMYITKDDTTKDYFHRFQKIKIDGKTWQVEVVSHFYGDGILKVCLGEYLNNTLAEEVEKENEEIKLNEKINEVPKYIEIKGNKEVYPFESYKYWLEDIEGNIISTEPSVTWTISDPKKAEFKELADGSWEIYIRTGKSGEFTLYYESELRTLEYPIKILSI